MATLYLCTKQSAVQRVDRLRAAHYLLSPTTFRVGLVIAQGLDNVGLRNDFSIYVSSVKSAYVLVFENDELEASFVVDDSGLVTTYPGAL